MEYHPVLLQASVDGLNIKPDGIYVDVTLVVEDIQKKF
jgi:16S rRNA (cytosine1402-N4)-methyltransferase